MIFRRLFLSNQSFCYSLTIFSMTIASIITFYFYHYSSIICPIQPKLLASNSSDIRQERPIPRIFCFIVTTPAFLLTRAKAINDTWAPRCDRYFFVTESLPQNSKPELIDFAKQLPIAPIKNILPGLIHLTQKSTLAFLFAYEKYFKDYDWFFKADDDTYLFVDHLKMFLSDKNTWKPVTYGYNVKAHVLQGYHAGGAGYVLSRESLQRFYQAHNESRSQCQRDGVDEDVQVAKCLRSKGVHMGKSLDKQNREYFHPISFDAYFGHSSIPDLLLHHSENNFQTGYNCCSDRTISFHHVTPEQQYFIDFLLYRIQ